MSDFRVHVTESDVHEHINVAISVSEVGVLLVYRDTDLVAAYKKWDTVQKFPERIEIK